MAAMGRRHPTDSRDTHSSAMRVASVGGLLSLMAHWSAMRPARVLSAAIRRVRRSPCERAGPSLVTITTGNDANTAFWNARWGFCFWRLGVRNVERSGFSNPAQKKCTGSLGVPHRLNEDKRRSFDLAWRRGFLLRGVREQP